jgi:hypothetical protein
MLDLGSLNPSSLSVGLAINEPGHITGYAGIYLRGGTPIPHAFIWPGRVMIDLNYLMPTNTPSVVELFTAGGMNDKGAIIGAAYFDGVRGYLLTPASKLTLKHGARLTNGRFQFRIEGLDGTCLIDATTNLIDWSSIGSVTISGGIATAVDSGASNLSRRYYRASVGTNLSVNGLGFLSMSIAQGMWMIGNPLKGDDNRIPALFDGTPEITEFRKYNRAAGAWDVYLHTNGAWSDPQQTLNPGEGAMITAQSSTILTFVGELMTGQSMQEIPAGWAVVGSVLPQAGLVEAVFGFTAVPGEDVYRFNGKSYDTFSYLEYAWEPEPPMIALGESIFTFFPSSRQVEGHYSIWP